MTYFRWINPFMFFVLFFAFITLGGKNIFAYNFTPVIKLISSTIKTKMPNQPMRIAVVYSEKTRNNVKNDINLISFKKQFSESIAKKASLADPITVNKLKKRYNLNYTNILKNSDKTKEFAGRMESNQIILIHLFMDKGKLRSIFTVLTPDRLMLTKVQWEFKPEKQSEQPTRPNISYYKENKQKQQEQPIQPEKDNTQVEETKAFLGTTGSNIANYLRSIHANEANQSWLIISPTAYVQPKTFFMEGTLWLSRLTSISLPVSRLRFNYRVLRQVTVGLSAFGGRKPQSLYGNIKFQFFQLHSGFALATGFRNRILYNKNYEDSDSRLTAYLDAKLISKETKAHSLRTLYLTASQTFFNKSLFANLYLDNEIFTAGSQAFLFPWLAFAIEQTRYYYIHHTSQTLIALQTFQGLKLLTFSLEYNMYTRKPMFSMGYNW